MPPQPSTLGFIGGGNMAEAIIGGVLAKGLYAADAIMVADKSSARTELLARNFGVRVAAGNVQVVEQCSVILFAVKPQNMDDVLAEIAPASTAEHLFLSICAGTRTETIDKGLLTLKNPTPRVVRIMPNTPALIGLGVAGICRGTHASADDLATATRIFDSVGITFTVEEAKMDAVTALTGSGPAYIFYVIESLMRAAQQHGFSPAESRRMIVQMTLGAATLASQSDRTPEELRAAVTSPGGTTAAGIAVLDEQLVGKAFVACVAAAEARGRELSQASKEPKST